MPDALDQYLATLPQERLDHLKAAARADCWRHGDLTYKFHSEQMAIWNAISTGKQRRWSLEISRKWGKTYFLVAVAAMTCQRKPKSRVVYGAPTLKHLEEFVIPVMSEIAEDAPEDCRPVFHASNGHWLFPNGSWVHIFGADDERKADRGRGPKAELAIFDEAGFPPDGILSYVIKSIFRPSLMLSPGSKTLLASTPARIPDHDFTRICEAAEANGTYFKKTIYDNPLLTPEHIQEEIRGAAEEEAMSVEDYKKSTDFLREYMAERVHEKALLVMGGDWELMKEQALVESERPQFFDAYEALDFGGSDPRAVLFGYYDFKAACLVIEDEVNLRNNESTEEIADAIKSKEGELYGVRGWEGSLRAVREEKMVGSEVFHFLRPTEQAAIIKAEKAPEQPYLRVCDHDIQTAIDLHRLHKLTAVPAEKISLQAVANDFRVALRSGRIRIDPRCKDLVRQLRTSEWTSPRATDFKRKNGEHSDLLWCAFYMWRNVRQQRNPWPANWGIDPDMVYVRPQPKNSLRALVGGKRR